MAAGQGYIEFATGDVLTAAAANGYLASQVVMVFASSAARTSAIASPQEGMLSYLKDTNAVEAYDGSAWISVGSTGDITGVTAGTGISGGGTSGTVTVTNSMATAIDAKGDLVAGTAADAFARLAVGTNGQVLTADSAEATGLKWATAAGGGKVLQVVQGTLTSSFGTTSTTAVDSGLTVSITPSSATSKVMVFATGFAGNESAGARTGNDARYLLIRGATQLREMGVGYANFATTGSAPEFFAPLAITYLDSPATTSSTTYKIQVKVINSATTGRIPASATNIASIVAMEIGA